MSALFSGPQISTPQATPPAPTVDEARVRVDGQRQRRTRAGRAATERVQSEEQVSTAARALTGN